MNLCIKGFNMAILLNIEGVLNMENKKTNTQLSAELIYKCEKTKKNSSKKDKPLTDNDIMKYEIASELGLIDKVSERGWAGLTAKEAGKIGGMLTARKKKLKKQCMELSKNEMVLFLCKLMVLKF